MFSQEMLCHYVLIFHLKCNLSYWTDIYSAWPLCQILSYVHGKHQGTKQGSEMVKAYLVVQENRGYHGNSGILCSADTQAPPDTGDLP